jgi:hypothetical protein
MEGGASQKKKFYYKFNVFYYVFKKNLKNIKIIKHGLSRLWSGSQTLL